MSMFIILLVNDLVYRSLAAIELECSTRTCDLSINLRTSHLYVKSFIYLQAAKIRLFSQDFYIVLQSFAC